MPTDPQTPSVVGEVGRVQQPGNRWLGCALWTSAGLVAAILLGAVAFYGILALVPKGQVARRPTDASDGEPIISGGEPDAELWPLAIIDEGVGWRGRLSVCDPAARIVEEFGQPVVVNTHSFGSQDEYVYGRADGQPAVLVVTVQRSSQRVTKLRYRGAWKTARGLKRGDTLLDLVRMYGGNIGDPFLATRRSEAGLDFWTRDGTRRVMDDQGLPRDVDVLEGIEVTLPRGRRCPRVERDEEEPSRKRRQR